MQSGRWPRRPSGQRPRRITGTTRTTTCERAPCWTSCAADRGHIVQSGARAARARAGGRRMIYVPALTRRRFPYKEVGLAAAFAFGALALLAFYGSGLGVYLAILIIMVPLAICGL